MRILLLLLIMLRVVMLPAQKPAEAYIAKFDSLAVRIMNEKGIPASVVLGIAIHESAAGTSKLARNFHNHFGINGKKVRTKNNHTSAYRYFESDDAAYTHFGEMIASRKFYPALRGNMDYKVWLEAIRKSGYAASLTWMPQVTAIIKKHSLTRFDKPVPASSGE